MTVTLAIKAEQPLKPLARHTATVTAMVGPAGVAVTRASQLKVVSGSDKVRLDANGNGTVDLERETVSGDPIIWRVKVGSIVRHLDLSSAAEDATVEWGDSSLLVLEGPPPDDWVTATGPPGSSAYQVAVANGFVGTEGEWLDSLKGEDGDSGIAAVESNLGAEVTAGTLDLTPIEAAIPTTAADIGAATAAQGGKADSAVQPGDLSSVAASGAYGDLTGKPTLGTAAAAASTDFATSTQGGKADSAVQPGDLSDVATSGDPADLPGSWAGLTATDVDGAIGEVVTGFGAAVEGLGEAVATKEDIGVAAGLVSALPELGAGLTESPAGFAATVPLAINDYSTAGTHTWNKPTGCTLIHVMLIAGGGGGASGRKGAESSDRYGGAGGDGGAVVVFTIPASSVASSVTVTVGAGGTGGAPITADSTNGADGVVGGDSSFGSHVVAKGGRRGIGGTNAIGAGSSFSYTPSAFVYGLSGVSAPFQTLFTNGGGAGFTGGGGSGSWRNASNAGPLASGAGGAGVGGASPNGGAAAGAAGNNGTNGLGGSGGAGGALGFVGGVGGSPGGGGGGGGAGINGSPGTPSGAGGAGGIGFVRVIAVR